MRRLTLLLLACCLGACASMGSQVRKSAAKDFSCNHEQTRIVDHEETIFRVSGCGSVATYECRETPSLAVHCDRVIWDDPIANEVTTAAGMYSIMPRSAE